MFDVVQGDMLLSTPETTQKPQMDDASQRARALLGSLKEKREFFESRIHVTNISNVIDKMEEGNFSSVQCPSQTKSPFSFSNMTTTLGSKIQERQNMLHRLTGSPNGSFRTANTQTTASTVTPSTSSETTVTVRVPPAPSLKDIEESIKEDVCVVIPVRDHSSSQELSTSWLEDSSDTQQFKPILNMNGDSYHDAVPVSVTRNVPDEKDELSPPCSEITQPLSNNLFYPLSTPSHRPVNDISRRTPRPISGTQMESEIRPIESKQIAQVLSTTKSSRMHSKRISRWDDVSKKKPEKIAFFGKENASNLEKLPRAKEKKETFRSANKPPRPSRRGWRIKRSIKDRRKTEMALSAAAVLLEPASSFEDHCDTNSCGSLKQADFPVNDFVPAGLRPSVVQEKDKIGKLAKQGLKVAQGGSRPTRDAKQFDSHPIKTSKRSVSFALPDEQKNHDSTSITHLTTVLSGNKIADQSPADSKEVHFISQNDAEMVPIVKSTKGEILPSRAKEVSPVVLVQYSEDSQEDRSAFLKCVFNTDGPLSTLKVKKDVMRISVPVNRLGILKKRGSNASDDSSTDFTSDSNTSGWMSGSGSIDGPASKAGVEDLSDIDVVIEKRNPRVISSLLSPRTSKEKVIYSAKLVSSPMSIESIKSVSSPVPTQSEKNECLSGGLLLPELDDRCSRKSKQRIPILLRPLVFASENQSDALSQCYGGMYSISSESIVEKRIQAFERKIRAHTDKYTPQFQPLSNDFPSATRGSLYDIAVHSGCKMDDQKLAPKREIKRKENPAKGGLYYLAMSSGLSRTSLESRCSYTIFTKTSACSVIESNGEVLSEKVSDETCGAFGSLSLARATLSARSMAMFTAQGYDF